MSLDVFKKKEGKQGFLSIGKETIDRELFTPIENSGNVKPRGGLWATKYDPASICYNEWLDYLTMKPHIVFYKYKDYRIPAVYFTLKDDAKILTIDSKDVLDNLKIKCPGFDEEIDYSLLDGEYDGMFIDVRKLSQDPSLKDYVDQYSVDTLVLFNLDCIKEYQKSMVYIEIEDRYGNDLVEYNVITKNKKYQLDEPLTRRRR